MPVPFQNRIDAGRQLASRLQEFRNREDVLVLALPRGGVPVGYEVARALNAPFDVFLVRKLGVPGHEELAMGAIASGGVLVLNDDVVLSLGIPRETVNDVALREEEELRRRELLYRLGRAPVTVRNRTVILVDDGLATGSSMRAAVAALKQQEPARVVVAVPAAAPETCRELGREVDKVVSAETPSPFYAVGAWYEDFSQISDDEVRRLLQQSVQEHLPAI
jgi:putative phosphoribosyl transferase